MGWLRKHVLPFLVYFIYRTLSKSWRVQVVESQDLKNNLKTGRPSIFAIWHGDELVMISLSYRYSVCTMTSTSKDGELMDNVLQKLGMVTVRGSTTRGAIQALKGLVRTARSGRIPVMAVDGPKGPYKKIKPGVFELAKLLKADIFCAGVAAQNKKVFEKAWNKTYLPHLFTKLVIVWSPAYQLPENVDVRDESVQKDLEKFFDAAQQDALALLAKS